MDKSNKIIKYWIPSLLYALTAVSAGMILYFILRYGIDVPYNDQWEYVGFFDHHSLGILTFEELFRLHNEYRKFFPNLIYVLLGSLTHWNVRYEMVVIFILACLVTFNIWNVARRTLQANPTVIPLLLFTASLFIFSPMQWENWLFGIQIEYYLPVVCVTACFLAAFVRMNPWLKLFIILSLCIVCSFSSVNGLIIWFITFPVIIWSGPHQAFFRKWYIALLWLVVGAASVFIYFHDYVKPEAHPSLAMVLEKPADAFLYFLGTLGNTFRLRHTMDSILIMGFVILFIFIIQLFYIIYYFRDRDLRERSVVWIMLACYSFGTSLLLTVGRMGYGLPQSFASRYTTFTLFAVVGVIFLSGVIIQHLRKRKGKLAFLLVIPLLAVAFTVYAKLSTWSTAVAELKSYSTYMRHGEAGLIFINFHPYENCECRVYPGNYQEIRRTANILDRMNYLRPTLASSPFVDELEGPESGVWDFGTFGQMVCHNDSLITVYASSMLPDTRQSPDAVLFTCQDSLGRPALLSIYNGDSITFSKTIEVSPALGRPLEISAWAYRCDLNLTYKLKGSFSIPKSTDREQSPVD